MARALGLVVVVLCLAGCKKPEPPPAAAPESKPAAAGPAPIELTFAFGSEKKEWLTEAIAQFNAAGKTTPSGRPIRVTGIAAGSGEMLADILAGALEPEIWSPASSMYLPMLNQGWARQQGAAGGRPLVGEGRSLVVSPVVIAMWKPMAEALGWPAKPVGWAEILKLATDAQGWASLGHPEWGHFKLGHTHPAYSNSGHLAVVAEAYAAVGATRGLTEEQLAAPPTLDFVGKIEESIVHYGKSTGFFAEKMLARGPSYLSAAVLYENLVVQSYDPRYKDRDFDLVAVYPKEGTFWIDNPFVVLDAPWVDAEERAAAEVLQAELLSRPMQERAMTGFGFRPADPSVAMAAPLDAAHGVDPKQPQTLLEMPAPPVLDAALAAWHKVKKPADVVFVFDKSGSMKGEPLRQAREGALSFVDMLDDRDRLTLLFFDNRVPAAVDDPVPVAANRPALKKAIEGVYAEGGTALYDAVSTGHRKAAELAGRNPKSNYALVVLSDGQDEHSVGTLDQLKQTLSPKGELTVPVRIFTIAYGQGADPTILNQIAEAGGGGSFKGDPTTIRQVYRDLAAFF